MSTNSEDGALNINSLPEEIIVKIFGYLTQNELARIARVCRRFNKSTRCPGLWKKIDVKLSWHHGCQYEAFVNFDNRLHSSVNYIKLDFDTCNWLGQIHFEEFCEKLKKRCPQLHTLILNKVLFTITFPTMINILSEFLGNLKVLILTRCEFCIGYDERFYGPVSMVEALDLSECLDVDKSCMYAFSKMPYLKKLNLARTQASDNWFWPDKRQKSFLQQLEVLHLGDTEVTSITFYSLQHYAINLTELYLCWANLDDRDFTNFKSVFPKLRTICMKGCRYITCDGIISFVQSCQSLKNVYVDEDVAKSYAKHSFVAANISKLEIVKDIDNCDDHEKLDFLLQK